MEKLCLFVAPIGESGSETRSRSDQVLRHIVRPAVLQRGFTAIRADEISEPGIITSQVIQHVVDAPLVVADLTDRNPNVFYELALRHMVRKPLVQLIRKGDQIPFDVAAMRTIPIDHRDLDSVDEAKREIVAQIDAAMKTGAVMETPISISIDVTALRQSTNPERRSLANVLDGLADVRATLKRIEARVAPDTDTTSDRPEQKHARQPSEWNVRRTIEEMVGETVTSRSHWQVLIVERLFRNAESIDRIYLFESLRESPSHLSRDHDREKEEMETALQDLVDRGLVELEGPNQVRLKPRTVQALRDRLTTG